MVKRVIDEQSARSAGLPRKKGESNSIAVLVVHGPNLNLLGEREPEVYGRTRLNDIDKELKTLGRELEMKVETFQSNSEGAIVDRIQKARGKTDVLLLNPGAYTHTSVAIRDAILAVDIPVIEVHLSNVYRRERVSSSFDNRGCRARANHGLRRGELQPRAPRRAHCRGIRAETERLDECQTATLRRGDPRPQKAWRPDGSSRNQNPARPHARLWAG